MKKEEIFSVNDFNKAEIILKSPLAKLSELNSKEIKDLAVVWCYYSGKIEGNTYTYVETEALLKDGITSEKRYEDARMLKNLYNTFISEIEYIHQQKNTEEIDERSLFRIHHSISSGLVSNEESGKIKIGLNEILYNQCLYENPLEKAVYLHCNMAKLQPFIDGNKRTARMIESITMMNADIIPVYSSKEADILNYRRGLIDFYETGNYNKYVTYFLDKQIDRINEIGG